MQQGKIVYADSRHTDPWFLLVSAGLADRLWGPIVATYGQRFTCEESRKDQKTIRLWDFTAPQTVGTDNGYPLLRRIIG